MKRIEQFLTAARTAFERVGAWVAGFTFWRFVLFSILVLIATNIIGGLLFKSVDPVVAVTVQHPANTTAIAPAPPAPDPAS